MLKKGLNKIQKLLSVIALETIFWAFFFPLTLSVSAQTATRNPISLKITTVTQDGNRQNTRQESQDKWIFDGVLSLNDSIRYNWQGVDLNQKYKTTPAVDGGWLKLYIDTVSEANYLGDQGTDVYPLQLSTIASKLKPGSNTLQFVYVNSLSKREYLPVSFTFNFSNISGAPSISVLKPEPKSVFMVGADQEINLELKNFKLTNVVTADPNAGKIFVYINEINQKNFLGKLIAGRDVGDGKFQVIVNSKDLDFSKVEDNLNSKLIFELVDSSEKSKGISTSLDIITNFKNTLNVGLPRVTIVEPKKNRTNQEISSDDKFIVKVENFEILKERPTGNINNIDPKKGFLQVIIISGDQSEPIQPIQPNTEFSLNDLGYSSNIEGQKTLKVQLVNQNFDFLKPNAEDTIDFLYKPNKELNSDSGVKVQNTAWRYILIGLTIILVVGGIAILIAKG